MMDKHKHTLTLGGKQFELTFNWGTIRRLKSLINADPLVAYQALKETTETVDFSIKATVAACTEDNQIIYDAWDELSPGDAVSKAMEVMKVFNEAFTMDEEAGGETGKDTQPREAADVS